MSHSVQRAIRINSCGDRRSLVPTTGGGGVSYQFIFGLKDIRQLKQILGNMTKNGDITDSERYRNIYTIKEK